MTRLVLAGAVVLLAALGLWMRPTPDPKFAPLRVAKLGTGAQFDTVFSHLSTEGTAHAPAIVRQGAGFDLIWFDGIRESHNDVRILRGDVLSGEVHTLLGRESLSARTVPPQTVLTLGNTIQNGAGYLATVVSLGGWAASSVMWVEDGRARKLSLSPMLNRSHLVKSPVIAMQDDWRMVPTYFEMGGAYGVSALLDPSGRVRAQAAMRGDSAAIQPMIVPLNETQAVALLRRFDNSQTQLLASWSEDAGQSWSAPKPLDIPNPSAPVAAVPLEDGGLLMVFNDDPARADTLTFAVSKDQGRTWRRTRILDGPGKGDLRYPMMDVLGDGRIAVTYSTGSKAGIVAHVLSADWALVL